jgi:hypothetical protein
MKDLTGETYPNFDGDPRNIPAVPPGSGGSDAIRSKPGSGSVAVIVTRGIITAADGAGCSTTAIFASSC